jgi:hypothetical protein
MNLVTNTRHDGTPSKICLTCASTNRLRHMPCAEHFPAMPSDACSHNRTKLTLIHNGTAIACYDCDLFIPTESKNN